MSARTSSLQFTGAETVKVEPVCVEAIDGPARGAALELEVGSAFVGSDPGCDLVLDDPHVSGRHARLELLPGAVGVTDERSRNGVFYLGARISSARVPIGAAVRLGKTTLRFGLRDAGDLPATERTELQGLVGHSLVMRRLFSVLERVGPSDADVLLRGETGTGKGAVARALHTLSARRKSPLEVFDCAAVSPSVAESELFGHVKGAFTGADRARAGVFERASGGTLVLDEVDELALELQPKLLRVLEERTYQRVGDGQLRRTDVRVIACTRADLRAASTGGKFRSDLYFRLAVIEIALPPLRQRVEDIPLLARHFAKEPSGLEIALDAKTLALLQCDPWPGNVRELRNAVRRIAALGTREAPAADAGRPLQFLEARDQLLSSFERDYLEALLARSGRNVSKAAKAAGVARSFLYGLLEKHGLK